MAPSQTFHDHIKEFRRRLLWVALAVIVSAGVSYALRLRIIDVLQHPLGIPLYYTSPAGSFNFIIKLSMVIGSFVALPVAIYHLLRFIEPALPIDIKKSLMAKVIGASFILALGGIGFGFFIMLPMSLNFFAGYSSEAIKPLIRADEYLTYVINNLLVFALAFQLPLITLFINKIKPLKPSKLLHYQRHVIAGSFVIALLLPFTYDPISQFVVAIPIIVLFYVSILLVAIANRRRGKPVEQVVPMASPKPVIPVPYLLPDPLPPLLDLRETSSKLESSREDSELLFSDGRVSKDTMTAEKGVMGVPGDTGLTGISRKSSKRPRLVGALDGFIVAASSPPNTSFAAHAAKPPTLRKEVKPPPRTHVSTDGFTMTVPLQPI